MYKQGYFLLTFPKLCWGNILNMLVYVRKNNSYFACEVSINLAKLLTDLKI